VPPKGEAEGLPVPKCTGLERGGDEVLAVPSELPGIVPVAPLESESAGLKRKKEKIRKSNRKKKFVKSSE
jgi:hypothetical protein